MNASDVSDLPPLPSYTLQILSPLVPGIPDNLLQMLAPILAYWSMSMFFHFIDTHDIWSQYRLHTPAELLKRNHATKVEVLKDVVLQQVVQTIFGLAISWNDPVDTFGKEDYDIATWAQRLRLLQRGIPKVLGIIGLDAITLGSSLASSHPLLAGFLLGGRYPGLLESTMTPAGDVVMVPAFAQWELLAAKATYWLLVPGLRFLVAIMWVDTWQYLLHRGMHMNQFLYTWLHSRHHRLYVPYAFGALYNHPLEGFLLDILGTGLAYLATGMTTRQGLVLYTGATFKTVDDHCGYALPWDPFQHISSNNAAYHDIHHQSWGIKTNFSQPFFTFWDRVLGTQWNGGDVTARYNRAKLAAQKQYDADINAVSVPETPADDLTKSLQGATHQQMQILENGQPEGPRMLAEEAQEEQETSQQTQTISPRKKTGSLGAKSGDSFRGLRERVASLHGGRTAILHTEGSH